MSGCSIDDDRIGLAWSGRYMPDKGDHGKIAMTLTYGLTDRLTLGADYRPLSDDLTAIGSFRLLDEKKYRPAVVIGTSADEFGSESVLSQAYHVILSKKIAEIQGWSVSPYAGPIYIQELGETNLVAGLTVKKDRYSLMSMWSGTDLHFVGKYQFTDHLSAGVVYWGLKTTGLTVSLAY